MEFSFFTTNNKSGYKTNQKWLEKNYPEELSKILSYCKDKLEYNSSIKEKIWFYYHKLQSKPKCLGCGKDIKFSERFDRGYNEFCDVNCINKNKDLMTNKVKSSIQKKYGVNFYPQHKDFIGKQKKTKKIKYGDENYNNINKMRKTCLERYGVTNFTKTQKYKDLKIKELNQDKNNIVINKSDRESVQFICNTCNTTQTIHKQTFYYRYKHNLNVCSKCFEKQGVSSDEKNFSNFFNSLNIKIKTSDRTILDGKEIDVFLPDHNIGFEYDGIYWHSEYYLDSNYHINKTKKANSKNVELFHIFSDEWTFKNEIVKSIIKQKCNIIDNKIFARNCTIKEVDTKSTTKFLNNNHIQGSTGSKIKIGLFYDEELVSIMTFSQGRVALHGKKEEYELVRFCNKINTTVVGGASKLLKYFKETYKPNKIVSYSDIRLFNGKLYENLGFKKIRENKPNYWYVINGKRYHRYGFRKSLLIQEGFDKNLTEHQIMLNRNILRIYDCGTIRWELNL